MENIDKIIFTKNKTLINGQLSWFESRPVVIFQSLEDMQSILSTMEYEEGFVVAKDEEVNKLCADISYAKYIYASFEEDNSIIFTNKENDSLNDDSIHSVEEFTHRRIEEYNERNKDNPAAIQAKLVSLEMQLESSDYKIIKAYEYSLVNKESEYNIQKLHEERQLLRNEINELREKLNRSESQSA